MITRNNALSVFKNHDEEATWFEAHLAGAWATAKPVKVRFAKNLSVGLNIRLDPISLEHLRTVSHDKGIGPHASGLWNG